MDFAHVILIFTAIYTVGNSGDVYPRNNPEHMVEGTKVGV